jgi:hypothetical protein
MSVMRGVLVCGLVLGLALPVLAQEPPKPTKEHGYFKQFEGTWEGELKFGDAPPAKFTVTARVVGGFWLISEHEGNFGGMAFKGHEVSGYDPMKKKVVATWVDNMAPSMSTMEGDWSADGKKLTTVMTGMNQAGKIAKWTSVVEFKDKDTYVFKMTPAPDNDDKMEMSATYKRKK